MERQQSSWASDAGCEAQRPPMPAKKLERTLAPLPTEAEVEEPMQAYLQKGEDNAMKGGAVEEADEARAEGGTNGQAQPRHT